MKLTSMERISLRNSKDVNEKMIQDYIFEHPECLEDSGLTYDFQSGRSVSLRVRIDHLKDYSANRELLDEIAAQAVENKA